MIRRLKNLYHLGGANLATAFYGFPSKHLSVIGVTGTDGKTTTSSLIYHILKESGKNPALISTVGVFIGGKQYEIGFHVTTPSSFALQRFIKKVVSTGSKYLVLEVSSHSLDQFRVHGISFDVGVLTNISHEHMDYHKTYENYLLAKSKLLKIAKSAVVNADDDSFKDIKKVLHGKDMITYGIYNDANITIQSFPFKTHLLGEFNLYNTLAAIACCKELGIDDVLIRSALLTFKPPLGRQDTVYDKEFRVMIDFAHTPKAFEMILPGIKKITKKRIIHVFGAAGKRDTTKRSLMGKASSRFSDIIILTSEDPRDESIEKIMDEISQGITGFQLTEKENIDELRSNGKYVLRIPNRKEAIKVAFTLAKKGDMVLLTGKGHEKSMNYGNGEEPWDEYKVVSEVLKK